MINNLKILSKYCHSLIKIKRLILIWSKRRRYNKYKRMNYCIRILSQQFYLGIHQVKKVAANNIKSGRNHQELKRSSKNQNKH